jgi:2-polyprenyl-3-methyl-5-hydroxy-6-metoxy-1,4-benzoquinol methylase
MGEAVKRCIVCGGKSFNPYCDKLISCDNCGLVVAKEIPNLSEIKCLYQKEYFFGKEYFDYRADRPALEWNFKKRIKFLKGIIGPEYNVIELGCAYGYFLNLVKNKVQSHMGFDITKDGVGYAKKQFGINATTEDFVKYPIKTGSIDSVFMWDVIEHLMSPDSYIEKIAKVLKRNGHLVLTTGDINALLPRFRKDNWRMIHPPTHIYYFSPKTIEQLLNKYGLTVERIKHVGVSRNVGSVFNQIINNRQSMNISTKFHSKALTTLKATKLDRLNIPVNTYDIMEVVARKV